MLETETIDLAGESTDPAAKPRPVVLIADDDLDARNFYADYLTEMGCRVVTAYAGLKAMTKAAECQPDVIVMDLLMPRLDGWESTARLKRSPGTRHIPVIVVSAVQKSGDRARAAGCDGFLAKPCSPELLWWKVRGLLEAAAGIHSGPCQQKGATVIEGKGFSHNPVILAFRPSGRKAPHDASAPTVSRASTTRRQTSPRRPDGERIAASECRSHRSR